ncbi:MAG: anthranilate synthase component I family protein [Planctomycetota bacterium]|nr:anthranilate synthase component I family protein [Planctomycetota bacterium]
MNAPTVVISSHESARPSESLASRPTVELRATPAQLVQAWPVDRRLLVLGSGADGGRFGRWSILAEVSNANVVSASGAKVLDALTRVDQAWQQRRATAMEHTSNPDLPFHGGWIGFIGFECGEWLEPAVTRGAAHASRMQSLASASDASPALPDLWMARCDAALVHDAQTGEWHAVGEPDQARQLLARALTAQEECDACEAGSECDACEVSHPGLDLVPIESDAEYEADVRRAIEYVHAGDVFQVNVARRFEADVPGGIDSWRAIGARALGLARYGAYLEVGAGPTAGAECAIASYSPELFLTIDPHTRRVVTRPIKGTKRSSPHADARTEFEANAKERAELHMIVDLMRNDLARVCEPRTVHVTNARVLEDHPTVLHGVGEVEGTLRNGATFLEILRATFPPGSVTGAPKIRAMQIIRELERAPRGPYCGAIGCLSDCGSMTWSVAIRTATMTGAHLTYWAGCGVVAESEPKAEVAESHAKAVVVVSH